MLDGDRRVLRSPGTYVRKAHAGGNVKPQRIVVPRHRLGRAAQLVLRVVPGQVINRVRTGDMPGRPHKLRVVQPGMDEQDTRVVRVNGHVHLPCKCSQELLPPEIENNIRGIGAQSELIGKSERACRGPASPIGQSSDIKYAGGSIDLQVENLWVVVDVVVC